MQDACYTRINKRLPCVDQNGKPLAIQPPFPDAPPRKRGGVAEVAAQPMASQPLAGAPPLSVCTTCKSTRVLDAISPKFSVKDSNMSKTSCNHSQRGIY